MKFTDTLKEEYPTAWEAFRKYYILSMCDNDENYLNLKIGEVHTEGFAKLHFDFQVGVLLMFLEENKIRPIADSMDGYWGYGVHYYEGKWKILGGMNYNTALTTRAQAYQKAISKSFKLLEGK